MDHTVGTSWILPFLSPSPSSVLVQWFPEGGRSSECVFRCTFSPINILWPTCDYLYEYCLGCEQIRPSDQKHWSWTQKNSSYVCLELYNVGLSNGTGLCQVCLYSVVLVIFLPLVSGIWSSLLMYIDCIFRVFVLPVLPSLITLDNQGLTILNCAKTWKERSIRHELDLMILVGLFQLTTFCEVDGDWKIQDQITTESFSRSKWEILIKFWDFSLLIYAETETKLPSDLQPV